MTERMEPTNRLRWSYRRQNQEPGWPILLPVLQQLWIPRAQNPYPGQDMAFGDAELHGGEWRDVPTENG